MIARRLGSVLLLLGLVCAGLAFSAPAQADASGVQVSTNPDGPFRDQLRRHLFAGAGELMPGDQLRRRFYVRNGSEVVARTTLAVSDSGPDNELAGAIDVGVDLGGVHSGGPLHTDDPDCGLTVTGPNLAPGAVQAIDVTLDFRDVDALVAMDQRASLDLLVTLTQVAETGVIETCGEQATADPVETDGQSGGDTCGDGAVVTVAGTQSCVPTSVDAGGREGPEAQPTFRERVTRSAFPALVLLGLGGGLVIGAWPLARRRRQEA